METLTDVTERFKTDHIFDAAFAAPWVAAAAGKDGLALVRPEDGAFMRLSSPFPIEGPILADGNQQIFFDRHRGRPALDPARLEVHPFGDQMRPSLLESRLPHDAFTTGAALYYITAEGDLFRLDLRSGQVETPRSPYGFYREGDHRVIGAAKARRGSVVLARHQSRSEHLLDSLPDDPERPKARVAVLKDETWGARISGPAVASRSAFLLCHEPKRLLAQHLRKPESRETWPIPAALAEEPCVLLAADEAGRVMAASSRGLDLLAGPGAPALFPFPADRRYMPSRIAAERKNALLCTREGRLFHAELE